ncbi:MAG: CD225/dispanin family protein [Candidatus Fermentibacteraceae bacterium]
MPLITCPDCGNMVSTSASVCPRCGRPAVPRVNAGKCPDCGAPLNPDGTCTYCRSKSVPVPREAPPKVANYIVLSVLMTAFCCLPFGIAAVISATQVDALLKSGEYEKARAASDRTKALLVWGFVITLLTYLSYGLMCGSLRKLF